MQDHDAAQQAEHRFKAHDQGAYGWIGALLRDDLEGVSHAAGQDAGVADRQPRGKDIG